MVVKQPTRLTRSLIAASFLLGAATVTPLMNARHVADAQVVGDSPVGTDNTSAATFTLTPPRASGMAARVHARRSLARGGKRLFGLGLALPSARTARADTMGTVAPTIGANTALGATSLPASVDLSQYDMPVGNQGQVNSCASWSTGYNLLGWYAHKYGVGGAPYAPMFVYSQLTNGQNVGTSFEGNFGIEQQQGIDTQADYTQGAYDFQDQPTAAERANAANYRITGYNRIYAQGSGNGQQAIETALAGGSPVVVGIPVYSNFMYATSANPFVDVPAAGSTLYGGHGILAVKYDANGLWIENQWGANWGLNGYAELSWAFVNQYLMAAYTIGGFSGAHATTPTATATTAPAQPTATATKAPIQPTATATKAPTQPTQPTATATKAPTQPTQPTNTPTATPKPSATATVAPSATPAARAQLSTSPASGPAGSTFTLGGSGFGSGTVTISWDGSAFAQVSTTSGSFTMQVSLSTGIAPGQHTLSAGNGATGQQATTTFTVQSPVPTSTPQSSPTPTATTPPAQPSATATQAPASAAAVTISPGAAYPGSSITISGSGFKAGETVTFYWNGAAIGAGAASSSGGIVFTANVSSTAAAGTRFVALKGATGDQASATFTVL